MSDIKFSVKEAGKIVFVNAMYFSISWISVNTVCFKKDSYYQNYLDKINKKTRKIRYRKLIINTLLILYGHNGNNNLMKSFLLDSLLLPIYR